MAVAYCWATGKIGIGKTMPVGALPLAAGDKATLKEAVNALSTLAYDNKTRLIPGFFTSGNKDKIEIVFEFSKLLKAELTK
jgi:hypothetical protein